MPGHEERQLTRRSLLAVVGLVGLGACARRCPSTRRRRQKKTMFPSVRDEEAAHTEPTREESSTKSRTPLREALFTGAAAHPQERWLATSSMTPHGEGEGEVVVWALPSGVPIHACFDEHGFGFESDPDALRWAPDGRRLAASAGTNAIAVLEDGRLLTLALPDDTRDHQVAFCWMGSAAQLYASAQGPSDRGSGAIITVGSPEGALTWTPRDVPPAGLKRMTFNAAAGIVVGDDLHFLSAVDVGKGSVRYHVSLAGALPMPTISSTVAWSADGRRFAVVAPTGKSQAASVITVFDGDDGRELARVSVEGHVDALAWSPSVTTDGHRPLAIVAGPAFDDPRRVHIFVADRIASTIEVALARRPHAPKDARSLDWSPRGDRLALVLRDGTIRIVDATSGSTVGAIDAMPRLVDAGVIWGQGECIIGLGERRLTFWTIRGDRTAHYSVKATPE